MSFGQVEVIDVPNDCTPQGALGSVLKLWRSIRGEAATRALAPRRSPEMSCILML